MTGGAGYILDMIGTVRYNKSLLKKKSYFKIRKDYHWVLKRKNLHYHHCSPKDLEEIRKLVIQKRKRDQALAWIALGIGVPLAALVCWFIVTLVLKLTLG
ncbi:MAG TPA: hypothetical protein P5228_03235 [Bacteroidales bacterium]|nr:hypothetical protein [Bacteroidales bacterium]HRZ49538.1 hypothetical protein [Bacteroidales bacterium]